MELSLRGIFVHWSFRSLKVYLKVSLKVYLTIYFRCLKLVLL